MRVERMITIASICDFALDLAGSPARPLPVPGRWRAERPEIAHSEREDSPRRESRDLVELRSSWRVGRGSGRCDSAVNDSRNAVENPPVPDSRGPLGQWKGRRDELAKDIAPRGQARPTSAAVASRRAIISCALDSASERGEKGSNLAITAESDEVQGVPAMPLEQTIRLPALRTRIQEGADRLRKRSINGVLAHASKPISRIAGVGFAAVRDPMPVGGNLRARPGCRPPGPPRG